MQSRTRRVLSFLHLSDLHCEGKASKDRDIALNSLLTDIADLREEISFVVFSGDIAMSGKSRQYEAALESLVIPLLERLALSGDRFLSCPGNHDVDRDSVSKSLSRGLQTLSVRDQINEAVDDIEAGRTSLSSLGLHDYDAFSATVLGRSSRGILFRTHQVESHGQLITVACLNTAWRASEEGARPVLGERQLDLALEGAHNSHINIAVMHHPPEILGDHRDVRGLLRDYHIICTGHHHADNAEMLSRADGTATVFSSASCLYKSRDHHIGYTIVELDLATGRVELKGRQYNDARGRAFSQLAPAHFAVALSRSEVRPILSSSERIALEEKMNQRLLPSVANSSTAPRRLRDIFVDPCLTDTPEYRQDRTIREMTHMDLFRSVEDLLIIGKKESGKTTLLDYVALWYLNERLDVIPVRADFSEIRVKGRNRLIRMISETVRLSGIVLSAPIEDLAQRGRLSLLLDNVCFGDTQRTEALTSFLAEFPNVRLVATAERGMVGGVFDEDLSSSLGRSLRVVYIHSMRNRDIRALTKKWFGERQVNHRDLSEMAVVNLFKARLPRSPFMVSVVLWILERHSEITVLNRATLMNQFTMLLLGRFEAEEALTETFGYAYKEGVLGYVAKMMSYANQFTASEPEFGHWVTTYFRDWGFEPPPSFTNTDSYGGILVSGGGTIRFRYQCFHEFYAAKAMMEDPEFYDYVIHPDRYLMFHSEIDCYTGLKGNCAELVEEFGRRLDEALTLLPSVSVESLDNLQSAEVISHLIDRLGLQSFEVTDEEHDTVADAREEPDDDQVEPKRELTDNEARVMMALLLLARVTRNSERVGSEIKATAIGRCMLGFCVITLLYHASLQEQIDRLPRNLKPYGEYFRSVIVPLAFQIALTDSLGTPKLDSQLRTVYRTCTSRFSGLLAVCVLGDLHLTRHFHDFEQFIKRTDGSNLLEICCLKLLAYYSRRHYDRAERERLASLIADVYLKKRKMSSRRKNEVLSQIRKHKPGGIPLIGSRAQ